MDIQLLVNVTNIMQIYIGSVDVITYFFPLPSVPTPNCKITWSVEFQVHKKWWQTIGDLEEPRLFDTCNFL